MTVSEFANHRQHRPCESCATLGVETQLNPNNNGLLVCCAHCGSKRPWGSLLYLKQNERRRPARLPLADGETLDSIWDKFGNRCVVCSAPRSFLINVGIGRQVHHVVPYAQEGHRGPVVPICAHCHAVVNERQRLHWFFQRMVISSLDEKGSIEDGDPANLPASKATA